MKGCFNMVKLIREDAHGKLTSFWDLRNADELYDEIIDKLKQFDKDENQYDTDVYLYVDDNMVGELYDFTNVGGNSWLDDDHYVLWTDKQRYDTGWSHYFTNEYEIADALGIPLDQLKQEVLDNMNREYDEKDWYTVDDIGYQDIYEYITDVRTDYGDTLEEIRCDAIDNDFNGEYDDRRKEIIREFDEYLNYDDEY
jgi:hypothetical protein